MADCIARPESSGAVAKLGLAGHGTLGFGGATRRGAARGFTAIPDDPCAAHNARSSSDSV